MVAGEGLCNFSWHFQPWLRPFFAPDEEKVCGKGESKDRDYGSEAGSDADNELVNNQDPSFEAGRDPQKTTEEGEVRFLVAGKEEVWELIEKGVSCRRVRGFVGGGVVWR